MKTYKGLDKYDLRKIALDSCVMGYKANRPDVEHDDFKIELNFAQYVATLPITHKHGNTWSCLAGIYNRYQEGVYVNI